MQFIDKIYYTWQQRGKTPRFDGESYGQQGIGEDYVLEPFMVPVKSILDLQDTCTTYKDIPKELLAKIMKESDSITAPSVPSTWMEGTDIEATKKAVEEAANLTITFNEMIKNHTLDPDKVINVDDFVDDKIQQVQNEPNSSNMIVSPATYLLFVVALVSCSIL